MSSPGQVGPPGYEPISGATTSPYGLTAPEIAAIVGTTVAFAAIVGLLFWCRRIGIQNSLVHRDEEAAILKTRDPNRDNRHVEGVSASSASSCSANSGRSSFPVDNNYSAVYALGNTDKEPPRITAETKENTCVPTGAVAIGSSEQGLKDSPRRSSNNTYENYPYTRPHSSVMDRPPPMLHYSSAPPVVPTTFGNQRGDNVEAQTVAASMGPALPATVALALPELDGGAVASTADGSILAQPANSSVCSGNIADCAGCVSSTTFADATEVTVDVVPTGSALTGAAGGICKKVAVGNGQHGYRLTSTSDISLQQ